MRQRGTSVDSHEAAAIKAGYPPSYRRVCIFLDADQRARLKLVATRQDRPAVEIVREAIDHELARLGG